jgi:opine dehydrogenase
MDSIIQLACIIHKTGYWRRTPEKLGLAQLSVSELTLYVNTGMRD